MSTTEKISSLIVNINDTNTSSLKSELAKYINDLINNDFNALLQLLYRIDIDEDNLKATLEEHHGSDSAILIAEMIIKRQLQKQANTKRFNKNDSASDEEKW